MGAMKTQVIQLDLHDDVISLRDKMSWAKTERILLVMPQRARILARTLDLRLIKRHAAELGAQIAIVARSEEQRRAARDSNIPAFTTIVSARRQDWGKGDKKDRPIRHKPRPDLRRMRKEAYVNEASWRSRPGIRLLFSTIAALAILSVLALFIPSATIRLIPATRLQSLTFTISASLKVTNVNLAGSLPARLTSVVVEHNKTVETTGSIAIPDSRAQGQVRFRNLTTALVGIPTGTVVSTQANPPVRFATTLDSVIEAGIDATVDVPVQAVEAGSSSNLSAGTLVAFEDATLGTSLSVTNPASTTGGTNQIAAIQTASDRSRVHTELMDELLEECKTNFQQTLSSGELIFEDTLAVSQVLSENYFPAEGQSGDTLSLTMRLQCQEQFASLEDVNTLVRMSLDASLPEGFTAIPGDLTTTSISLPKTNSEGITSWKVLAQRLLQARLDAQYVVQTSLGRSRDEAILHLTESLPLDETPVIEETPGWWPWLPSLPFRISIQTSSDR